MDTNFNEDSGRTRPPDPERHATRRDIMAALAVLSAGLAAPLWTPPAARSEDGLPTGLEAADLAAKVTKASWPKPKSFVPGMHYQAAYWRLARLLKSYAAMHLARLGTAPSASHMLSVADVISDARCSWSALGAWLDDKHQGFRPNRFPLAWRQAKIIDLERDGVQVARLNV